MSDINNRNRTPRQIIEEFAEQAASIMSGRQARTDNESRIGGEVMARFRNKPSVVCQGRGHSVKTAADGNAVRID